MTTKATTKTARKATVSPSLLVQILREQHVPVGEDYAAGHLATLAEADRLAPGVLATDGVLLDHGEAVDNAIAAMIGDEADEERAQLDTIDAFLRKAGGVEQNVPWASDVATALCTAHTTTAYYLGLAIGFRLAGVTR